ncbi:13276_t:CDS:2, partial [Gigaspora rosea]
WAPVNKISFQKIKGSEKTAIYFFTLWDLPKGIKAKEIKAFLTNSEQREKSLKENWLVYLDHGKTYRATPGKFDIAKLEERNRYR